MLHYFFKDLKKKFDSKLNKEVLKKVDNRNQMANISTHLFGYLLDPKAEDIELNLTSDEKEAAQECTKTIFHKKRVLTRILKFCGKNSSFN